ncbi:hypothetical protein Cni_G29526 [Canna indica]|uniref:Uncharacterized protein n=1 Tax=Canna indica TaxID=4628 RepID=A0AAQ3L717_9LILI|nr:hypothetical protein Cni_G29526 [Canna indica]
MKSGHFPFKSLSLGLKPTYVNMDFDLSNYFVDCLILNNNWNDACGLLYFHASSWKSIKLIRLPPSPYDDAWVWDIEVNGFFTTNILFLEAVICRVIAMSSHLLV